MVWFELSFGRLARALAMVENTVEEVATPGCTLIAPCGGEVRDSADAPLTAARALTASDASLSQNMNEGEMKGCAVLSTAMNWMVNICAVYRTEHETCHHDQQPYGSLVTGIISEWRKSRIWGSQMQAGPRHQLRIVALWHD